MWFKNLQIYRLPAPWAFTPEQLEAALAPMSFVPATSNELLRQGWDSPRGNGMLVHTVNKQMLILLGTEKKLLPTSVINQVAKAKAAAKAADDATALTAITALKCGGRAARATGESRGCTQP